MLEQNDESPTKILVVCDDCSVLPYRLTTRFKVREDDLVFAEDKSEAHAAIQMNSVGQRNGLAIVFLDVNFDGIEIYQKLLQLYQTRMIT